MAEGNQDRTDDFADKIKLLNDSLTLLATVNSALAGMPTELQRDTTTSSEESETEEVPVDNEHGSLVKEQGENPPKSSNSTEVGPESPAPAVMECLHDMISSPGKSKDGVITETEESRLEPDIETRRAYHQSNEESLIKVEKLLENPSCESFDDNITTAESNSELLTEQAHVEDVKNSSAQFPQAIIDEKSEFSPKPRNSNTQVTTEKRCLESEDNRDPIAEKPNLVPVEASTAEPKSENLARLESFKKLESSVASLQDFNSGESSCVDLPKDAVADTETSAVDVAVDSSPKDQNETKPTEDSCKQSDNISNQLKAEE